MVKTEIDMTFYVKVISFFYITLYHRMLFITNIILYYNKYYNFFRSNENYEIIILFIKISEFIFICSLFYRFNLKNYSPA